MRTVAFSCPKCQQKASGHPGSTYLCPGCGQKLLCPTPPVENKTVLGNLLPQDVLKARCHNCGAVINAHEAVRRKMPVYQSHGFGVFNSGSNLGGGGHGSFSQAVYGMVDLCQDCNRSRELKAHEANERNKKLARLYLLVAGPVFVIILAFYLGICLFGLPSR